ncbi:uncharacterized protein A4U43_C06F8710 [Asparagus officinalis]|uniref:Uncharacterized protein n=1 Tax=Asparagus officinalis TaxID=4686 RepID=A0A5P1EMU9_ASPOF|nr:uncharacterized protein A4U43_C06F8710 [Asparagus officinalis]
MASVYIPVQNSEGEVRVALDQLPRDTSDILDILKAEQAPLDLWLIIAREYFKQGKIEQFWQSLEEGSVLEIDEYYANVKYERIAILNALGAYHTYLGKLEMKRENNENFKIATQYYNRASRIDVHEPSTWIGKGYLFVAKGDLQQASGFFKIVLDEDPNKIPALLGQACVEFNQGENQEQYKATDSYKISLKLFKRALQVHPNCPGVVKLGIDLCRYRLDPESVEALVALGIMDLQTNEVNGDCSSYKQPWLDKITFILQFGKVLPQQGDFEKAGRYYMASVKEINRPQDFVLPFYGLGQVQLKLGDFRSSLSSFEKAVGHIYVQLGQNEKALEIFRKAARIDPRDAQVI